MRPSGPTGFFFFFLFCFLEGGGVGFNYGFNLFNRHSTIPFFFCFSLLNFSVCSLIFAAINLYFSRVFSWHV